MMVTARTLKHPEVAQTIGRYPAMRGRSTPVFPGRASRFSLGYDAGANTL